MKKIVIILAVLAIAVSASEVYATFSVQAMQSADLSFSANGIVDRMYVDVGDTAHKGKVLATLQSDDIRAAVHIVEVAREYARRDFQRLQSVKEVTDQTRLDGIAFKYENAKAQLAYKQALLSKTILKAPFDGVIVSRQLEVGDTFTSMRPVPVYRLQSIHERKLILSFDQKYWHNVHPGDRFEYTIDGDKKIHKGVITKIYPVADARSRKMQAEVTARDIPVGLFGEGKILLNDTAEK
jgi:RND family efflux transporter MFP subunit